MARTGIRRQEVRQMAGVQISEAYFLDFLVLQQIIRARGTLQARAKY